MGTGENLLTRGGGCYSDFEIFKGVMTACVAMDGIILKICTTGISLSRH